MKTHILSPSLLSADFSDLASALERVERLERPSVPGAAGNFVHLDVMDGHFVPQITFGEPVIKSLRARTALEFDVHLMVEHPERMVDGIAAAGADWITFHWESTVHVHRLIRHIQSLGKKAGIAIVPSTPVSALEEVLPLVDLVLVMTVNPGFAGQELIAPCLEKIARLRGIRTDKQYKYLISADGGMNNATVGGALSRGADVIVSGSAFFNGTFDWD